MEGDIVNACHSSILDLIPHQSVRLDWYFKNRGFIEFGLDDYWTNRQTFNHTRPFRLSNQYIGVISLEYRPYWRYMVPLPGALGRLH